MASEESIQRLLESDDPIQQGAGVAELLGIPEGSVHPIVTKSGESRFLLDESTACSMHLVHEIISENAQLRAQLVAAQNLITDLLRQSAYLPKSPCAPRKGFSHSRRPCSNEFSPRQPKRHVSTPVIVSSDSDTPQDEDMV